MVSERFNHPSFAKPSTTTQASRACFVRPSSRLLLWTLLILACSVLLPSRAQAQVVWPDIVLVKVVDGLSLSVHLTTADDGSNRLFVVEKQGRIQIIKDGVNPPGSFLDISDRVGSSCGECGLLSVAFPPDYAESGYFYVYYTSESSVIQADQEGEPDGKQDTVVARFRVSAEDPDRADPNSEERLLLQNQPQTNHNGGQLAFGPDGMLYIGLGDGGGGGDPYENGQDLASLLGKILRIQVGPSGPYTVPNDNPFIGQTDAKPEIWAYGLRNPWRFSFDSATGDLYIGDVGQGTYEEIDRQPAAGSGGENYGWDEMEGLHCYPPGSDTCDPDDYVLPIAEYGHGNNDCSVTGGVVHHSPAPGQAPVYLYGDFCTGRIRALQPEGGTYTTTILLESGLTITSFGQDMAGNSYVVDYNGGIYRVAEPPRFTVAVPLLRQD